MNADKARALELRKVAQRFFYSEGEYTPTVLTLYARSLFPHPKAGMSAEVRPQRYYSLRPTSNGTASLQTSTARRTR